MEKQLKCLLFLPQGKVPEGKRVPTDINYFSFSAEVSGKSVSGKSVSDKKLLVLRVGLWLLNLPKV